MKILVIGDPHIKVGNILESEQLIERLVTIAEAEKPQLIVVAGDILDKMDQAEVNCHVTSTNLLRRLYRIGNLLVLIGNHDLSKNDAFLSNKHFFTQLYEWPNTMIADTQCKVFKLDDVIIAAVPYVANGRFEEALKSNPDYNPETVNVIFAHQQFIGCNMNGIISTIGDTWSDQKPLVVSGHIHQHQYHNGVIYVGTPRQSSFRDTYDKTVSVFEFFKDKPQTDSILSNGIYVTERRIAVGLPTRIKQTITASQVLTWIPPPNCIIRLEITGTHSEIAAVQEHYKISEWEKMGIHIVYADIVGYQHIRNYIEPIAQFETFSQEYLKSIQYNQNYMRLYETYVTRSTSMLY